MEILNYINGEWVKPEAKEFVAVINPATGEIIARTPLCGRDAVEMAASAGANALPAWRSTPAQERIQYLFKLRDLLRANSDEIARNITIECGKTFDESRAEIAWWRMWRSRVASRCSGRVKSVRISPLVLMKLCCANPWV
jgi:malonate-semialdehyde dehydrogenase (acetylating)/methylmalonate-semialdehyde dehydrogenase